MQRLLTWPSARTPRFVPTAGFSGLPCNNATSSTLRGPVTRWVFTTFVCSRLVLKYSLVFVMLQGDLLIMNALTAEPYCGCDPLLLRQYYFSPLGLCYEHNTRGPCETGLLFAYNHTAQVSQFEAWKIQTQQMCMKIIDCFKICSKRWKTGNSSNTLPF